MDTPAQPEYFSFLETHIELQNRWTITFQEATLQVTINPKQPSRIAIISQDHSKKKQKWCLETSSKNSPRNKHLHEPKSSSNHTWRKKTALPTGPRHLELLNFSQFLLQGPHPPTQGLRTTWIHRWQAPQRAGLAQGQLMLGQTPQNPKPNHLQIGLKGGGGKDLEFL